MAKVEKGKGGKEVALGRQQRRKPPRLRCLRILEMSISLRPGLGRPIAIKSCRPS